MSYDYEQYVVGAVSAGAAVLTLGVGLYAVHYAKKQIEASQASSPAQIDAAKAAHVTQLFRDHLEMAVSHPDVSSYAAYLVSATRARNADSRLQLNEKYRWFIAHLLLSQEEVLELAGDDAEWASAVMSNLTSHAPYFTRPYWQSNSRGNYTPRLVAATDEAIENFEVRFGVAAAAVQNGPTELDFNSIVKGRA